MTEQVRGTMTSERAMEIVEKIQGPEGYVALVDEINTAIQQRTTQIAGLTGEINALKMVRRLIGAMNRRIGLEGDIATEAPDTRRAEGAAEGIVSQQAVEAAQRSQAEIKERIAAKKCTFKAQKTKKWCARTLRSKAEQECGYCRTHMSEVGLQ